MERNMEFFMNEVEESNQPIEVEGISKYRYPKGHEKEGQMIPWLLKPSTTEKLDEITQLNTKKVKVKRNIQKVVDQARITNELMVECIVYPDFTNKQWMEANKCIDSVELLLKVLKLPGDYAKMSRAVCDINGLSDDESDDLVSEAKN